LSLAPEGQLAAERVVALPRLEGPAIDGVPTDGHGFIPTDPSGYVRERADIFAAGDATTFPIKQGGLAAQQADAAAEEIASLAGADVEPEPFRPILRGLILTGRAPLYARAELTAAGSPFLSGSEPLWWPPGKIVGRYLAPFLAERSGTILDPTPPPSESLSVAADLTQHAVSA
jgi:sulfide:quinone oxidoreductase